PRPGRGGVGRTSVVAPPQVDRVVDLETRLGVAATLPVLVQHGGCGGGVELDADDRLQVLATGEAPPHVDAAPLPAVGGPEAFDLVRVDHRVAATEPGAEGGPGGVVVDDHRRAAAADHAVELGQSGFAPGTEEVGPPDVHDVDGGVRQRDLLGGAGQHA